MSESVIDELYREIILDHFRKPHRRGIVPGSTVAEGENPTCGDSLRIGIEVREGKVAGYSFDGSGCAISQASASILGDTVEGKDVALANGVASEFEAFIRDGKAPNVDLGEMEALSGVSKLPMRVKCATLAARTLRLALNGGKLEG